jgi:hypothetical protein
MRTAGMFILHVEPETAALPTRVSIALSGATPEEAGVLHITPICMTRSYLEREAPGSLAGSPFSNQLPQSVLSRTLDIRNRRPCSTQ